MDPEIRSFLNKIKVIADPAYEKTFPALKKAGVTIYTTQGQTYTIEIDYPLGDYRDPMDDKTFFAKFDSLVLPFAGREKRDHLIQTVNQLETVKDVNVLTNLLRA